MQTMLEYFLRYLGAENKTCFWLQKSAPGSCSTSSSWADQPLVRALRKLWRVLISLSTPASSWPTWASTASTRWWRWRTWSPSVIRNRTLPCACYPSPVQEARRSFSPLYRWRSGFGSRLGYWSRPRLRPGRS